MEIIEILAKTPLPTAFMLFGFIVLSIGFGLKLKVIFDVDNLNKTYAKIAGMVFFFSGFFFHLPNFDNKSIFTDPFLIYYLIGVLAVSILFWVVLKFTPGEMQVRAIKYNFFFIGFLATMAVIWRALDIFAYISNPELLPAPLNLYIRSPYWPYFVLIGFSLLISYLTIIDTTREQSNLINRDQFYFLFLKFYGYMFICRVAWEFVDWIARIKIPLNN